MIIRKKKTKKKRVSMPLSSEDASLFIYFTSFLAYVQAYLQHTDLQLCNWACLAYQQPEQTHILKQLSHVYVIWHSSNFNFLEQKLSNHS